MKLKKEIFFFSFKKKFQGAMRASTGSGCFDMRFVHHEITYLETVEGPYGGSGPIIHSYFILPKKTKKKRNGKKAGVRTSLA